MAQIDEFLNSKSMLTPGLAGALTMLITNALGQHFDLPHKWVALGLSLLLGLIVLKDKALAAWERAVFYVLNSLIIFSTAVGTSTVASAGGADDSDAAFGGGAIFFASWF